MACLEGASPEYDGACLSEARQHLSKGVSSQGESTNTLACLMLAESECLGTHKKKQERMERHLQLVRSLILRWQGLPGLVRLKWEINLRILLCSVKATDCELCDYF